MQMEMLNVAVLLPPNGPAVMMASCLNAARASHGVAQDAIHAQFVSQGTGVVNVHLAYMAM
jgi:hypothetical protein